MTVVKTFIHAYLKRLSLFFWQAPWWVYFSCGLGLFFYQCLDAIDGKQARRTGSSSPLGELFDHGCDAVSTVFVRWACMLAWKVTVIWPLIPYTWKLGSALIDISLNSLGQINGVTHGCTECPSTDLNFSIVAGIVRRLKCHLVSRTGPYTLADGLGRSLGHKKLLTFVKRYQRTDRPGKLRNRKSATKIQR